VGARDDPPRRDRALEGAFEDLREVQAYDRAGRDQPEVRPAEGDRFRRRRAVDRIDRIPQDRYHPRGDSHDEEPEGVEAVAGPVEPGGREGTPGFRAVPVAARAVDGCYGIRREGRTEESRHRGDEARRGDRRAARLPRREADHQALPHRRRGHPQGDGGDEQEGKKKKKKKKKGKREKKGGPPRPLGGAPGRHVTPVSSARPSS